MSSTPPRYGEHTCRPSQVTPESQRDNNNGNTQLARDQDDPQIRSAPQQLTSHKSLPKRECLERDYYNQLFSSDSENELDSTTNDTLDTDRDASHINYPIPTDVNINMNFHTQERDFYTNLFTPESANPPFSEDRFSFASHVPTFKFDFHPTTNFASPDTGDTRSSNISVLPSSQSAQDERHIRSDEIVHLTPAELDLPVPEIDRLLGFEQPLPKIMPPEVSPSVHADKIGTFNVQNKFTYTTAAELMVGEDFAFLALQEPHGAQHTNNESWQAFNKCELQSARIDCFETQYQVILVDTWKWGGKTISDIGVYLQGRIISIAFGFSNGAQIGIISIYASSAETHQQSEGTINDDIISTYDGIISEWNKTFPCMNTIVIGDFQETCTTSNKDNLGSFRREKNPKGILAHVEDTHASFIRAGNAAHQYLTRFGQAGARGLDHMMVSNDPNLQKHFSNPRICRQEGHSYFASDHSLLICEYGRNDVNNNEDGQNTTKFNYSTISRIKLKSSGEKGETLEFDESQFKGSVKFMEQKQLYNKLQDLTSNSSDITTLRLPELEKRVESLFSKLWQDGIAQKVSGENNKLIRIDEQHAVDLAYTYEKFQNAIKEVMEELSLSSTKNDLEKAGKTRGRLRQRAGFKMFKNLPIPTKLRYLRMALRGKLNLIKKAQLFYLAREVNDVHSTSKHTTTYYSLHT